MSLKVWDHHLKKIESDPEYRQAWDALEDEFSIAGALIEARARAKMTQAEVAIAMGVSQPAIARIESGKSISLKTLRRYAKATGSKLKIELAAG